jgi:uncharacterized protein (TIGR03643 family)
MTSWNFARIFSNCHMFVEAINLLAKKLDLSEGAVSEIIEMALSDHTSFAAIKTLHGLSPDQVKELMRANLKTGSYRAWRKRVSTFGARREHYK